MEKLVYWVLRATIGYFIIIAITVAFKFDCFINLELNELGDFLAGVFGPVAFLWLVLGFFQQGKELKISSSALQLQVKELQGSVEQQTRMASIAERSLIDQLAKSNQASEPMIEVVGYELMDPTRRFLQLKNHSASCEAVTCSFEFYDGHHPQVECFDYLPSGSVKEIDITTQPLPERGAWFVIRYKKNTGIMGVHRYWVKWDLAINQFKINKADLEMMRAAGLDPDQQGQK